MGNPADFEDSPEDNLRNLDNILAGFADSLVGDTGDARGFLANCPALEDWAVGTRDYAGRHWGWHRNSVERRRAAMALVEAAGRQDCHFVGRWIVVRSHKPSGLRDRREIASCHGRN